jgi:Holliday junction resolvase RusA-like endonuclease
MPPSVNALYAGKGRRYKSSRYKYWETTAQNALRSQSFTPLGKIPLEAHYQFGRPDMRTRDLANLEKAISDFLVHMNVIADDCWIHKITMEWADVTGAHVVVTPLPEARVRHST